MELILLVAVIVFLVGMTYTGYRKGAIYIVLSLAMSILAIILSLALSGPCKSYIKNHTPIYDKVNEQMTDYVSDYISSELDGKTPEEQKEAIKKLKLPSSIQDKLIENNNEEQMQNLGVETFSSYIAQSLTDILLDASTILILFVIIKLILRIIVMLANIVSRLPIIRGLNRSLGGVTGFIEGILIIWVLCLLLTAVSGTEMGGKIFEAVSTNPVLNFIYCNNILTKIIL